MAQELLRGATTGIATAQAAQELLPGAVRLMGQIRSWQCAISYYQGEAVLPRTLAPLPPLPQGRRQETPLNLSQAASFLAVLTVSAEDVEKKLWRILESWGEGNVDIDDFVVENERDLEATETLDVLIQYLEKCSRQLQDIDTLLDRLSVAPGRRFGPRLLTENRHGLYVTASVNDISSWVFGPVPVGVFKTLSVRRAATRGVDRSRSRDRLQL